MEEVNLQLKIAFRYKIRIHIKYTEEGESVMTPIMS